jgi:hypothetical protein
MVDADIISPSIKKRKEKHINTTNQTNQKKRISTLGTHHFESAYARRFVLTYINIAQHCCGHSFGA